VACHCSSQPQLKSYNHVPRSSSRASLSSSRKTDVLFVRIRVSMSHEGNQRQGRGIATPHDLLSPSAKLFSCAQGGTFCSATKWRSLPGRAAASYLGLQLFGHKKRMRIGNKKSKSPNSCCGKRKRELEKKSKCNTRLKAILWECQ